MDKECIRAEKRFFELCVNGLLNKLCLLRDMGLGSVSQFLGSMIIEKKCWLI